MAAVSVTDQLKAIMARREVREIVYFHTDHFEPWRNMLGRAPISEENVADVVDFVDATSEVDFARRLTLFYWPSLAYRFVDGREPDLIQVSGDKIGFRPLQGREIDLTTTAMRYVAQNSQHDIQLHYHHEHITTNTMYALPEHNGNRRIGHFLKNESTPGLDRDRFELGLRQIQNMITSQTGRSIARWFFVHGRWALNASDPRVCSITNEIALLQRNGFFGDFTFPAGREVTNPMLEQPFLVEAADVAKCYDCEQSHPEVAAGTAGGINGKFFIWASKAKAPICSIDYFSNNFKKLALNTEQWALDLVEQSNVIDHTLYIKTHAHSMYGYYFQNVRRPIHPHLHPEVQRLLGMIFEAGAVAGAPTRFFTAPEVYDKVIGTRVSEAERIRINDEFAATLRGAVSVRRIMDSAAAANGWLVEFMRERIARLGPAKSGAYDTYVELAKRGEIIRPYEMDAVKWIAANAGEFDEAHVYKASIGAVPLVLSALGVPCLAIEADGARAACCRDLLAAAPKLGDVPARVEVVEGSLGCEAAHERRGKALAVLSDLITTASSDALRDGIEKVKSYRGVLFDAARFLTRRSTAAEYEALCALFAKNGFEPPVKVTESGSGWQFYYTRPLAQESRQLSAA